MAGCLRRSFRSERSGTILFASRYWGLGFPSDFDIRHSSFAILRVRPLLLKASTSHLANVKQTVVIFNFSPPYILEAAHARASEKEKTRKVVTKARKKAHPGARTFLSAAMSNEMKLALYSRGTYPSGVATDTNVGASIRQPTCPPCTQMTSVTNSSAFASLAPASPRLAANLGSPNRPLSNGTANANARNHLRFSAFMLESNFVVYASMRGDGRF